MSLCKVREVTCSGKHEETHACSSLSIRITASVMLMSTVSTFYICSRILFLLIATS